MQDTGDAGAPIRKYKWPADLDRLNYEDMKWLAHRFSPKLVTFPIYSETPKPGDRPDYHPIDVRQLFLFVSAKLSYESSIGIKVFLDKLGRTFPVWLLAVSTILLGF